MKIANIAVIKSTNSKNEKITVKTKKMKTNVSSIINKKKQEYRRNCFPNLSEDETITQESMNEKQKKIKI